MRRSRRLGYMLAAPLILVILGLLAAPIISFFGYSFYRGGFFKIQPGFTLANYKEILTTQLYWRLGLNALEIGLATSAVSVLLGYFLAYWIRFGTQRLRRPLLAATVFSILGGYLVRVYAWRIILGTQGILNSALVSLGVIDHPLGFALFSKGAVVLALVNIYVPFSAVVIFAALENVAEDQLEAARDLGARGRTVFWQIALPLTGRAVFSSLIFVFLLAAGDYVTPQLLGGTRGEMISVTAANQFIESGNWALGSAISFTIVTGFALVALVIWTAMRSARLLPRMATT